MQLDQKKIISLEYVFIAAILVLFFVFDIRPMLNEASQINNSIRLSKMKKTHESPRVSIEDQKKDLQLDLKESEKNYFLIKQAFDTAKKKIVKKLNVPLVTQEIVNILESSNIEVILVRPLEIETKGDLGFLPIEIKCRGKYTDLVKLFSKVEYSPIIASIQDLKVERVDVIYPKLDASLKAYTLFLSEEK